MATIRDVAKLAGVAPVTASRALNSPNIVNETTRQRVRSAAEQLGYRPNMAARGLRTGRAHLIAVSCPQRTPYDPVLFEFCSGVSQACDPSGYSMLIDRKHANANLDGLVQTVDGIIITDVRPNDPRIVELQSRIPMAVFGPTEAAVPSLDLDEYKSMRLALGHLRELGYGRIAFITHEGDQQFVATRKSLYLEFVRVWGGEPVMAVGSDDFLGGYAAMGAVATTADAVVAANETMAIGILRFQTDHPEFQMPVVSINGGFMTDLCSPRLTTVTQPFFHAGVLVGAMLLEFIRDGMVIHSLLEPHLVLKESTWPKGGRRPEIRLSDILNDTSFTPSSTRS